MWTPLLRISFYPVLRHVLSQGNNSSGFRHICASIAYMLLQLFTVCAYAPILISTVAYALHTLSQLDIFIAPFVIPAKTGTVILTTLLLYIHSCRDFHCASCKIIQYRNCYYCGPTRSWYSWIRRCFAYNHAALSSKRFAHISKTTEPISDLDWLYWTDYIDTYLTLPSIQGNLDPVS